MKCEKQILHKRLTAMVLSIAMVVGSSYVGRGESEAAESLDLHVLTTSDKTEFSADEILTDDSGQQVTLADLDKLIIHSDGEITIQPGIENPDAAAGNSGLQVVLDYVDGDLIVDGVDFICSDIQSEGTITVKSGVELKTNSIELSSVGRLYNFGVLNIPSIDTGSFSGFFQNEGTVIADTVVLNGTKGNLNNNYNEAVFQVKDSFAMTGFNDTIGTVLAEVHTKMVSDGGACTLYIGDRETTVVGDYEECEAYELFGEVSLEYFDRVDDENYLAISGVENEIYAKDEIVLTPQEGYLVKTYQAGSEYASSITLTKDDLYPEDNNGNFNDALYFYLMNEETGEYTTGDGTHATMVCNPMLTDIIFDDTPPTVNVSATADGKTVDFADGAEIKARSLSVSLEVADENLVEPIEVDEGEVGLTESDDGKKTAVLEFEIDAEMEEEDHYIQIEDLAGNYVRYDFRLIYAKEEPTASITVEDIYVGEAVTPVLETNSDKKDDAVIEYKLESAPEEDYDTAAPTAAGKYKVRATIPESETYAEKVVEDTFEIKKLTATVTITIADCEVGDEIRPEVTCVSTGSVTFAYKYQNAADTTYTDTPPTAAGNYTVRATVAETDTYEELSNTANFTISKYTPTATVTVEDIYVGSTPAPVVDTDSNGDKTIEYKKSDAEDSTYTTTEPTEVGEYVVRATIAATATYEEITCTDTFEILAKKTATVTVSVDNTVIGTAYTPTATCESTGQVTFEYKIWDYDDEAYSSTKPTAAGKYMVRATVSETATYEKLTGTAVFTISRKSTTATVTVANTIVGETYVPVVETNSDGTATFLYKVQGTADSTYTVNQPTAAGDYTVQATVPETDEYEKKICTADFTISRKTVDASVTIDDLFVDDVYNPVVDTESDGSYTFEYKAKDAMDTTYTGEKPTAAGEYMVRATIAETDTYEKIVVFDEFTISKIQPTSSVTVGTVYAGNTFSPDVDTDSDGSMTIEYKTSYESELFYTTLPPTGIGEYSVRVTIAETEKYKESVCSTTFTITAKQVTTVTVNVENTVIGTDYDPEVICESTGLITLEYKAKGADDDTYTETKPTAAGDYTVRATVGETLVYAELTGTANFTISRKTTTATVTVADTTVGETYAPVVETNSDGTATFLYKVQGAEDTTYKTAKPTAAGDYTVQATIPETDEYEKYICTGDFTISKFLPTATISVPDTVIGTIYAPELETNSDGTVTIEYKKSGAGDSTFTEERPTAAGDYEVRATIAESANYKEISCTDTFTISKKTPTASIEIEDYMVGYELVPHVETDSDGVITVMYKEQGEEDSSYSTDEPVLVGEYDARATIAETDTWLATSCTCSFRITAKVIPTVAFSISDTHVGESPTVIIAYDSDAQKTVEYKVYGEDDSAYQPDRPTAAGYYTARLTLPETAKYEGAVRVINFRIEKIVPTASIAVADTIVGQDYSPKIVTDSDGAVTYEYKAEEAEDSAYTTEKPSAVGEYLVRATIAETEKYEKIVCSDTFRISPKKTAVVTIDIEDITIGEKYDPKVTCASDGAVTVEYKEKDAADTTYTETKPTAAGSYTVRAVVAETETYAGLTETADFTINKKTATATVSVSDITEGTIYTPSVTTTSNGKASFEYKKSSEDDSAYTTTQPDREGTYTVRATIAETETYKKVICTADFTIHKEVKPEPEPEPEPGPISEKRTPVAQIKINSIIYYGTFYAAEITTDSDAKEMQILYRNRGTGSGYFLEQPTAPGSYSILLTMPATEKCNAVRLEKSFEIRYLPAPAIAYGFDGEIGNNDFYTTDIRVVAPKGYEIATSLDGTYKESVDYDQIENGIFLRKISDGAKTAAISVAESLKKDKERPKLSNLITDENGKSLSTMGDYYANELHLSIEDENLILVRVNNTLMQVDDALAELILETNGGEELFRIYAEDAAGNGFTLTIRLLAAWMKTGIMPAGMKVILKTGNAYKLDQGQWKRTGDETVYAGGGEFYVDKDTECTFNKVN